jgi:hypothetical protein
MTIFADNESGAHFKHSANLLIFRSASLFGCLYPNYGTMK